MNDEATRVPILFCSPYHADVSRVGADFRSAQIFEICRAAGFEPKSVAWTPVGLGARLVAGIRMGAALRRRGMRLRWRELSLAGFHAVNVARAIAAHRGARILLWESTGIAASAWVARASGYSVVALSQYFESLDGTVKGLAELQREVDRMALADRIFCISEEEMWLLANLRLTSDWLPYYPPQERCATRAKIAGIRAAGIPHGAPWLVIGSAYYPPNREGLERLLRWLGPITRRGTRVTVVGFGTEDLAKGFVGSTIDFLGPVSEEMLMALLSTARGLIVHQDRGAGVITRIPDALLAGLPVIANGFAARGTAGYQGISVYDTPEELQALLESPNSAPFSPPPPPRAAQARLGRVLHELALGQDDFS